jgi:hypothetical protein
MRTRGDTYVDELGVDVVDAHANRHIDQVNVRRLGLDFLLSAPGKLEVRIGGDRVQVDSVDAGDGHRGQHLVARGHLSQQNTTGLETTHLEPKQRASLTKNVNDVENK